MGEVTQAWNLTCQGQPLISRGCLFGCYNALEKWISWLDSADTEHIARKTPVQRIMRKEGKNLMSV